jgi:hypothetical protein
VKRYVGNKLLVRKKMHSKAEEHYIISVDLYFIKATRLNRVGHAARMEVPAELIKEGVKTLLCITAPKKNLLILMNQDI